MLQNLVTRGSALVVIYAFDLGLTAVRMVILSHFLDLRELGFASLLAALYATLEQATDVAMYKFVLSSPREDYGEALASAHALSVLRGLIVGVIGVAIAPFVAQAFHLGAEWLSFAALGLVVFIRSFEHLEPRVAERDYRYGAQAKIVVVSNSVSLAALVAGIALRQGANALILSFLAYVLTFIACTRLFSQTPYRLRFRSRFFKQAFKFGYPLMVNGVGIAVGSQADRYLVGAMLDLPALGFYSVLTLATTVPTSVVTRMTQVVTMAALFNAGRDKRMFEARLRLTSGAVPVLAGFLALGILTLMNDVVPLVFGHKFVASRPMVILLAFTVFVRLVRNDPGTSLLLTEGRTRRLALANLFVMGGIVFSTIFLYLSRTIEASVAGRLAGELIGLIAMHYLARIAFQGVGRYNIIAITGVSAMLGIVSAIVGLMPPGRNLPANLALLVICAAAMFLSLLRFVPSFARVGFSGFAAPTQPPPP
jgi:O-antigen/teichoic acid export membrane protein